MSEEINIPIDKLLEDYHPFGFTTSQAGHITLAGTFLQKLFPRDTIIGSAIDTLFNLLEPKTDWSQLLTAKNKVDVKMLLPETRVIFKGSAQVINKDCVLFIVMPLFNKANYHIAKEINIKNFPAHSLFAEYFFLMEFQRMAQSDSEKVQIQQNEIKKLNAELAVRNEKLNLTLNSINAISCEIDYEEKCFNFYANEEGLFGIAENMTMNFSQLFQFIHKDSASVFYRLVIDSVSNSKPTFQCRFLAGNIDMPDNYSWKLIKGSVIKWNFDGTPSKGYAIIEDFKDKMKLEEDKLVAEEVERFNISREIHDSIGQWLVGSRYMIDRSIHNTNPAQNKITSIEVNKILDQVIKEARILINKLGVNLIEDKNLMNAFNETITHAKKEFEGTISLNWTGKEELVDYTLAVKLLRGFQEILYIIIKSDLTDYILINFINTDQLYLSFETSAGLKKIENIDRLQTIFIDQLGAMNGDSRIIVEKNTVKLSFSFIEPSQVRDLF